MVGCLDPVNDESRTKSETSPLTDRTTEDVVRGREGSTGPPLAGGPPVLPHCRTEDRIDLSVVYRRGVPGEGTPRAMTSPRSNDLGTVMA